MNTLVTKAECYTHLRLTNNGSKDTIFDHLISKASGVVEIFCNRAFSSTIYEELYSGDGSAELMLDNYPIISITALSTDIDKEAKTYSDPLDAVYMILNKKAGIIKLYDTVFGNYDLNIYIKYTAGYASIPEDIKLVVLDLIAKKYYDSEEKRFGMESKSLIGQNVTFSIQDLTENNRKILQRWQKPPRLEGSDISGLGWAEA